MRTSRDPFASFVRAGIKPGLERMERLLERLDHPERRFRSILVAGTNGKGTTAAVLASCLQALGHHVGLFTSPHLVSVRERFQINGRAVALARLEAFLQEHGALCRSVEASYFEVTTACALWTFARAGVEWAVLEIGLGGRWDACNAVDPELSVITSISRDHTEYLGNTLSAIAGEKAQVARPGRPIVIGDVPPLARGTLNAELDRIGAVPHRLHRDFQVSVMRSGTRGSRFAYVDPAGSLKLDTTMPGASAIVNAGLAVRACRTLTQSGAVPASGRTAERAIAQGVRLAVWPGRLQIVSRRPLCVLDVAHNVAAIRALVQDWTHLWPGLRPVVVMALLGDKEIGPIVRLLAGIASRAVLTAAESTRSVPPADLARCWPSGAVPFEIAADIRSALETAFKNAGPAGAVLVCGSHYLVGPAMSALGVRPYAGGGAAALRTKVFRGG